MPRDLDRSRGGLRCRAVFLLRDGVERDQVVAVGPLFARSALQQPGLGQMLVRQFHRVGVVESHDVQGVAFVVAVRQRSRDDTDEVVGSDIRRVEGVRRTPRVGRGLRGCVDAANGKPARTESFRRLFGVR